MSMPTLVNLLASNATRGRANAAHGLATSLGFIVGPLVAGAMIGAGAVTSFVLVIVAGCLAAALFALFVRTPATARDHVSLFPVRK
jgi:MFS family permease